MDWEQYKSFFVYDGSYIDICVPEITLEDWTAFLQFLKNSEYTLTYLDGGKEAPLPDNANIFFTEPREYAYLLHIGFGKCVLICDFMFSEPDFVLDFIPACIDTEQDVIPIFDFMRQIGNLFHRDVFMVGEGIWQQDTGKLRQYSMFHFDYASQQLICNCCNWPTQ